MTQDDGDRINTHGDSDGVDTHGNCGGVNIRGDGDGTPGGSDAVPAPNDRGEPTPQMSLPATQTSPTSDPPSGLQPNTLDNLNKGPALNTQPPLGRNVPKYPKFITPDILQHLRRTNCTSGWTTLVDRYLDYEITSPSKSVSTFLPLTHIIADRFFGR